MSILSVHVLKATKRLFDIPGFRCDVFTVAVSTMKHSVERVKNPRAVVVRFPRGATIGPPNDIPLQRRVILGNTRTECTSPLKKQ